MAVPEGDHPAARATFVIHLAEKGLPVELGNEHASKGLPKHRFFAAPDDRRSESLDNVLILDTAEKTSDIDSFPSFTIPAGIEKFLS
jgi:hypothetical protein